jgi:hypothetical protein
MLKRLLVIALIGYGAWHYWHTRPIHHAPGVVAPADPQQFDIENGTAFEFKGYHFTPRARFKVQARVLGAEHYRMGREAELAPVDLALGWGPMSDDQVLGRLKISQGNRFYYYSWEKEPPIPPQEIVTHSANMHMIPADSGIEKRLASVRRGNIVEFDGQLVWIQADDGWRWQSSLTRTDMGNGACEVVLVKDIQVH